MKNNKKSTVLGVVIGVLAFLGAVSVVVFLFRDKISAMFHRNDDCDCDCCDCCDDDDCGYFEVVNGDEDDDCDCGCCGCEDDCCDCSCESEESADDAE